MGTSWFVIIEYFFLLLFGGGTVVPQTHLSNLNDWRRDRWTMIESAEWVQGRKGDDIGNFGAGPGDIGYFGAGWDWQQCFLTMQKAVWIQEPHGCALHPSPSNAFSWLNTKQKAYFTHFILLLWQICLFVWAGLTSVSITGQLCIQVACLGDSNAF